MTAAERKRQIVFCIRDFIERNGYPPSVREIGGMVGIGSPSTVSGYVSELIREGELKRNGNSRRCVVPVDYTAPARDPWQMETDSRRVCLKTADGGTLELDYSITMDARHRPQCTFQGILDCTGIKKRISRIVACKTED